MKVKVTCGLRKPSQWRNGLGWGLSMQRYHHLLGSWVRGQTTVDRHLLQHTTTHGLLGQVRYHSSTIAEPQGKMSKHYSLEMQVW